VRNHQIAQLTVLAEMETRSPTGPIRQGVGLINWTRISTELDRDKLSCADKWKSIQACAMKKGPFAPEEDAIIAQRVGEWGLQGNGLWKALETELGRSTKAVFSRWKTTLSKRVDNK